MSWFIYLFAINSIVLVVTSYVLAGMWGWKDIFDSEISFLLPVAVISSCIFLFQMKYILFSGEGE